MRKADIKSLIWLHRWYGGRSQRLDEIHQAHLSNLTQLVVDELGGMPQSEAVLSLYGFSIVVSFGALGIEVVDIHSGTNFGVRGGGLDQQPKTRIGMWLFNKGSFICIK